jgi:ribonuclease Z
MRQLELETSWGHLRIAGGSRAGEGTVVLLPQLRLALDAGRPVRALVPMRTIILSHGHLDHTMGLLGWASQRQLQGMPAGTVFAPPPAAPLIAKLLEVAASLEGGEPYGVEVRPVAAGDRIPLREQLELELFGTSHWIETLGSLVIWTRHRLREDLEDADPDDLRDRRAAGEEITVPVRTRLLAYLADTGPEVVKATPVIADTEVVVVECTFVRPSELERAARFGHLHLDHLVEVAPRLHCRHLVVTHLSRRHRLAAGERAIRSALEPLLAGRLHFLNTEWE